jgi:hypothetical protein
LTGNFLSSQKQSYLKEAGTVSESEKMDFPEALTTIGNLLLFIWIALDSYGIGLINIGGGIAFFIVALIVIYGVLKLVGCFRECNHCKRCTKGFGRMAALYFGKRSLKDPKETYGIPAAIFFYTFVGPFPATILLAYTVSSFSVTKLAILVVLLVLSIYSGLTWRQSQKK